MTQITIATNTSSQQLLNPNLVAALHLAFPTTRESLTVHSSGQRRVTNGFVGSNGPPDEFGEEYQLDCPFCGDSRGRMQVNHSYDPTVHPGRWHCYRRDCHSKLEHRNQFVRCLQAVWSQAKRMARNPSCTAPRAMPATRSAPEPPVEVVLPEPTIPINQLSENHPALAYLRSRNFDPNQLWQYFQVGYCEGSHSSAPAIGARIVVPICAPPAMPGDRPTLLGWQAREIPGFTQDRHPDDKYLTKAGFRKSHHLYAAVLTGPVGPDLFIVEGVTDVWRIGPSAVALLGKAASRTQLELLVQIGQFKSNVYVALDSDAESQKRDLVQVLQERFSVLGVRTQVHSFDVPDGRNDVGECNRSELVQAQCFCNAISVIRPPVAPTVTAALDARPTPPKLVPVTDSDIFNLLAPRLIEHATGTVPEPGADLPNLVHRLGMSDLIRNLELPLHRVLRAIEGQRILIQQEQLCRLVCSHAPFAKEAVRLRRTDSRPATGVNMRLDSLGTRTGRITTSDYNFQGMSKEFRPCAVAMQGRKFVYADYGQFEWRVAAALSQDPQLMKPFSMPRFDLYHAVATALFGQEHAANYRQSVKDCMMRFLFSRDRLSPVTSEGQAVSQFLARQHPHLLQWLQALGQSGKKDGCVRTPHGRVVRLPYVDDGHDSDPNAVNYLIQAAAADVFKYACLAVDRAVDGRARILLPLHDALLLDCANDQVGYVVNAIVRAMETPFLGFPVRLEVKTSVMDHWE